MALVNLRDITIPPGRVRKDFPEPAKQALIESILSKGLLHPPVVDRDLTLLAGERRLQALQDIATRGLFHHCNGKVLQPGLCFVTFVRELSPLDRMEAEIEENEIRLNLSWQEKANATAALHELRTAQLAASTLPGILPLPQAPRDTAAEIRDKPVQDVTIHEIRDTKADLLVAAWLQEDDPDVSNAKTRKEALSIIERKLNEGHQLALSREFKARQAADQTHSLIEGDLLVEMRHIPDSTFDVIIADPPYGRSAHTWANGLGNAAQHNYLDDMHTFETLLSAISNEGYRVCKPKAHLYCFCDINSFPLLHRMFTSAGWDVWPRPLIWYKGNHGSIAPRPEHGPRQCYEAILFANKGDKRVLSLRHDTIFIQKRQDDSRAAEKPASLFLELLSRSCLPGDFILDPCCGTGPVFPASNKLSCRATGIDLDPAAIGIASTRLNNTVAFSSPPDYPTEGAEELMIPSPVAA